MKEKERSLTPEELVKRRRTRRHIFLLILNTVLFFGVYQALLYYAAVTDQTFWSFAVMLFYLLLTLGFTLGYLIYNRFLQFNLCHFVHLLDWIEFSIAQKTKDFYHFEEKSLDKG